MNDPIIITGTTSGGNRFVQFWNDRAKIAGQQVNECVVSMNSSPELGREKFRIGPGCPDGWIDHAVMMFARFRAGESVRATHTVEWTFGNAVFTPAEIEGAA